VVFHIVTRTPPVEALAHAVIAGAHAAALVRAGFHLTAPPREARVAEASAVQAVSTPVAVVARTNLLCAVSAAKRRDTTANAGGVVAAAMAEAIVGAGHAGAGHPTEARLAVAVPPEVTQPVATAVAGAGLGGWKGESGHGMVEGVGLCAVGQQEAVVTAAAAHHAAPVAGAVARHTHVLAAVHAPPGLVAGTAPRVAHPVAGAVTGAGGEQAVRRQETLLAEAEALHAEAVAGAGLAGAPRGAHLGGAVDPRPAIHTEAAPNARHSVWHAAAVHAALHAAHDAAVVALKAFLAAAGEVATGAVQIAVPLAAAHGAGVAGAGGQLAALPSEARLAGADEGRLGPARGVKGALPLATAELGAGAGGAAQPAEACRAVAHDAPVVQAVLAGAMPTAALAAERGGALQTAPAVAALAHRLPGSGGEALPVAVAAGQARASGVGAVSPIPP
jgi:hypothetical protein